MVTASRPIETVGQAEADDPFDEAGEREDCSDQNERGIEHGAGTLTDRLGQAQSGGYGESLRL